MIAAVTAGWVVTKEDEGVFGAHATGLLGAERDVHAVLLVVAEPLGELVGQVDLLVDAADHELDGRDGARAAALGGGAGVAGTGADGTQGENGEERRGDGDGSSGHGRPLFFWGGLEEGEKQGRTRGMGMGMGMGTRVDGDRVRGS